MEAQFKVRLLYLRKRKGWVLSPGTLFLITSALEFIRNCELMLLRVEGTGNLGKPIKTQVASYIEFLE